MSFNWRRFDNLETGTWRYPMNILRQDDLNKLVTLGLNSVQSVFHIILRKYNQQPLKSGALNVNFRKISVRETI